MEARSYREIEMPDALRRALADLDAETLAIERQPVVPREYLATLILTTDYTGIEERRKAGGVKWRIPLRKQTCLYRAKLRRNLTAAERRFGLERQTGIVDRPNAGQPLVGPLPLPACGPRPNLQCAGKHGPFGPFVMPSDAVKREGFDWYFRAEGCRRILAKGGAS